jgi:hypothetical protein
MRVFKTGSFVGDEGVKTGSFVEDEGVQNQFFL